MSTYNEVTLVIENGIAIITINRPKALNALNDGVFKDLIQLFTKDLKPNELRGVIITGAGEKAFVAGADIKSMNETAAKDMPDYVNLGQRVMRMIETFPVPVVAAVDGFALGGGLELALACDLIFANASAKLGQPEVNLGVIPGFGGTQRLLQRCSIGAVRRLVYTGEVISAEEAFRLGVVDRLVPNGEMEAALNELYKTLSQKGPLAIEKSKEVIRVAAEKQLLEGLRAEVQGFLDVFESEDRVEGMTAFLEKRAPQFAKK